MGHFSRNKGKVGERELARELSRVLGVSARRGVQFCGGPDSPDVVTDIPGVHIECKRSERFRLYEALEQASEDGGESSIPVVMHRQNKKPWVAVVRLDDLPQLVSILTPLMSQAGNLSQEHLNRNQEKTSESIDPSMNDEPRS